MSFQLKDYLNHNTLKNIALKCSDKQISLVKFTQLVTSPTFQLIRQDITTKWRMTESSFPEIALHTDDVNIHIFRNYYLFLYFQQKKMPQIVSLLTSAIEQLNPKAGIDWLFHYTESTMCSASVNYMCTPSHKREQKYRINKDVSRHINYRDLWPRVRLVGFPSLAFFVIRKSVICNYHFYCHCPSCTKSMNPGPPPHNGGRTFKLIKRFVYFTFLLVILDRRNLQYQEDNPGRFFSRSILLISGCQDLTIRIWLVEGSSWDCNLHNEISTVKPSMFKDY